MYNLEYKNLSIQQHFSKYNSSNLYASAGLYLW